MAGSRMKIATFNINHINKRLENLLEWLEEAQQVIENLRRSKRESGKDESSR